MSEMKQTSKWGGGFGGVLSSRPFRFLLRPANRHPDGEIK